MAEEGAIRNTYIRFQKEMFSIGLKDGHEDKRLLALLSEEEKEEAFLFAEYLISHPIMTKAFWNLSWSNVLHLIRKEPLDTFPLLLEGIFRRYVETLAS